MSSGFLNVSLGKARSTLKGCGGSGEPEMRDVVHGTRVGLPCGRSFFGESAAACWTDGARPRVSKMAARRKRNDRRRRGFFMGVGPMLARMRDLGNAADSIAFVGGSQSIGEMILLDHDGCLMPNVTL